MASAWMIKVGRRLFNVHYIKHIEHVEKAEQPPSLSRKTLYPSLDEQYVITVRNTIDLGADERFHFYHGTTEFNDIQKLWKHVDRIDSQREELFRIRQTPK